MVSWRNHIQCDSSREIFFERIFARQFNHVCKFRCKNYLIRNHVIRNSSKQRTNKRNETINFSKNRRGLSYIGSVKTLYAARNF